MEYDVLEWYKDNVICFYDILKTTIKRDKDNGIESLTAKFSNRG